MPRGTNTQSFEESLHKFWKQLLELYGPSPATLYIEVGDRPNDPGFFMCNNSEILDDHVPFKHSRTENIEYLQTVAQSWVDEGENCLAEFLIALKRRPLNNFFGIVTLAVWKATVDEYGNCDLHALQQDDIETEMMDFLKDLLESD